MRRILSLVAVCALSVGLVGALGGSAGAGSGEVGYTVGFEAVQGGIECDFYSVALATGELTRINDPLTTAVRCADGLTFAPDGTLYAYASDVPAGFPDTQLVTIDLSTGAQTVVGDLPPVLLGSGGMTFDGSGALSLYGLTQPGIDPDCATVDYEFCMWRVEPSDASTEFVGSTTADQVTGLAATCTDVYAIGFPSASGLQSRTNLYQVDTATAGLEELVDVPGVFGPAGLDFDFAGGLWALGTVPDLGFNTEMEVANIDPATGLSTNTQLTLEGDPFVGFLEGLAISPLSCEVPPPTPEPVVLQPTFTG